MQTGTHSIFSFRTTTYLAALALAWGLQGCAATAQSPSAAQTDAPTAQTAKGKSAKTSKTAETKATPAPDDATTSMLKKRAAQTLGVSASAVTISNLDAEGGFAGRINFTATAGKSSYMCYVTRTVGITSDAICTRRGGGIVGSESNALLRAADGLNRKK